MFPVSKTSAETRMNPRKSVSPPGVTFPLSTPATELKDLSTLSTEVEALSESQNYLAQSSAHTCDHSRPHSSVQSLPSSWKPLLKTFSDLGWTTCLHITIWFYLFFLFLRNHNKKTKCFAVTEIRLNLLDKKMVPEQKDIRCPML